MHSISRLMLLTAMVFVWVAPAVGEYYRYTDSDGVVRFTDDLSGVPPDQLPEVKTYESSLGSPDAAADSGPQFETASWAAQTYGQATELDQIQMALNRTFRTLGEERARLESQAIPAWAPVKERDDYRRQVEALNARIERYEAQRADYSRRVDAFNAQFNRVETP